ncbi:MAG TPA: UDP-N-acetylmuramoyl-L-alanyl-D-glutamate--2,6-diaminopimelate ligase, partial [Cyanobacteria bacterium UBA11372]|nr:UDP-N-acetylmuramoyl-L-alanyl-D-glutamate--2,6-diaminopimelate ligase [Cyanobacteria bacterium UBA11372]
MKLRQILTTVASLENLPEHPALDAEVKGLKTNSHACEPGDLFIGMPGTRVDGGEFWPSAIASGAVAALVTPQAAQKEQGSRGAGEQGSVPCVIPVTDMTKACASVAAAFYDYPAKKMKMVGVTGTNGKTTTTHLIEYFLNKAEQMTMLMGTLYARWQGFNQTANYTTPFAV